MSKITYLHKTYGTRYNDVSRKHPLKYFSLKCHIWWEINKTYSLLGVYRSVSVSFSFVLNQCHAKCPISLSLFSRDPDWPIELKLPQVCHFRLWWIYHYKKKAYSASNCFVSKNQFCNVPLKAQDTFVVSIKTYVATSNGELFIV